MAKQPQKKPASNKKAAPVKAPNTFSWSNFRAQSIILAIICFMFYANTLNNNYALDDELVITRNQYVQKGFDGIPLIFTSDAYSSYEKQMNGANPLAGGRYRPLSIASFAIEQRLFGTHVEQAPNAPPPPPDIQLAHIQHFTNILLYIISIIALLYFLRNIVFPGNHLLAFLSTLLFAIHPLHTEVVANIKSRDEILSLLFILFTLIYAWRYTQTNKRTHLMLALSSYFLALLSKEYAITLIALIPLLFYVKGGFSIGKSIKTSLPYAGILLLYLLIRFSIVPLQAASSAKDILNDPYLFASASQRLATIIATQFNYIKLLFFPHPLSSDYGYDQIPYLSFSSPWVWLSMIVYLSLIVLFIRLVKQRHILSFVLAFFLLNWLLISNFFFNIGATMGERLIYHSSVGFAIIIAYILYTFFEKNQVPSSKTIARFAVILIIALCGFKTIQRNKDWQDNISLYTKDIQVAPNSVALNANMGTNYAMLSDMPENKQEQANYLNKAITYWSNALHVYSGYAMCYINRASAYMRLGQFELAMHDLDSVKKYNPEFPTLHLMYASCYLKVALRKYGGAGRYQEAIAELQKGLQENPKNATLWYFTGVYYANLKQYDNALYALDNARKLSPNDAPLLHMIDSVQNLSARNNR